MPPRVLKKSAAPRRNQRESKEPIIIDDEHDLKESSNEAEDRGIEAGESQETSPSQSQSQENNQLEQMITDMMQAQRKRHSVAKANVYKSYEKSVSDVESSIRSLFDSHDVESARVHETHIKRLQQLLAKKAEIEISMQKKVSQLQKVYRVHALSLETVVSDRARQLG